MEEQGYEIKQGKYIAFRHQDKDRFTRAKTIGEDYTEERLKERLKEALARSAFTVKKPIGKSIDARKNVEAKNSPAYANWITKHNLKTTAESIVALRNLGIQSITQLDALLTQSADERQSLQDEIRKLETQMDTLSQDMENAHTVHAYRELYKYHKAHPEDKAFAEEYRSGLAVYKVAASAILERYSDLPNSREILKQLDNLAQKKNALMSRHEDNKAQFEELIQYRQNYEQGIEKKMER